MEGVFMFGRCAGMRDAAAILCPRVCVQVQLPSKMPMGFRWGEGHGEAHGGAGEGGRPIPYVCEDVIQRYIGPPEFECCERQVLAV